MIVLLTTLCFCIPLPHFYRIKVQKKYFAGKNFFLICCFLVVWDEGREVGVSVHAHWTPVLMLEPVVSYWKWGCRRGCFCPGTHTESPMLALQAAVGLGSG